MVGCSECSHIHFLYGLVSLLSSAKEQWRIEIAKKNGPDGEFGGEMAASGVVKPLWESPDRCNFAPETGELKQRFVSFHGSEVWSDIGNCVASRRMIVQAGIVIPSARVADLCVLQNTARYVLRRSKLREPLKTPCSAEGCGWPPKSVCPSKRAVGRKQEMVRSYAPAKKER